MSARTGWILFSVLMTQTVMGSDNLFARIKSLEGTWYALDESGQVTDQVLSRFEVTAGGSAVREVEFPGSNHEMTTMYRQTATGVVADHYCVLGNKPAYRVRLSDDATELVYELANPDEVAQVDEKYMGEGHLKWLSDHRVDTRWVQFENGQSQSTVNFSMARKSER